VGAPSSGHVVRSHVCALELVSCCAECCLRVLLLELRVCCGAGPPVPLHGALQGTGAGYYCRRAVCIGTWESAVCAMKLGCWCRGRGWLRDVNGSVGVGP
jgi:hypothetical protein